MHGVVWRQVQSGFSKKGPKADTSVGGNYSRTFNTHIMQVCITTSPTMSCTRYSREIAVGIRGLKNICRT